jgi:hypothetical protein
MVRYKFTSWALAVASAAALIIGASARPFAQDPPPAQDPVTDPAAGRGGRQGAPAAPRPYAQVVTSAFKTDDGIFKVHRGLIGGTDSVLFEIPKNELDKDFVWNVHIKKTTRASAARK